MAKDFDKERRDLYAVSLVITLYCFAGAELTGSASSPVGVSIARPEVVVWAIVVAWVYFLWRYWLAVEHPWSAFATEVAETHLANRLWRRSTLKVIEHRYELMKRADGSTWAKAWAAIPDHLKTEFAGELDGKIGMLPFGADWRLSNIDFASRGFLHQVSRPLRGELKSAARDLGMKPVKWWPLKRCCITLIGLFRAARSRPAFSDRLLPLILCTVFPLSAMGYRVFCWYPS